MDEDGNMRTVWIRTWTRRKVCEKDEYKDEDEEKDVDAISSSKVIVKLLQMEGETTQRRRRSKQGPKQLNNTLMICVQFFILISVLILIRMMRSVEEYEDDSGNEDHPQT